MISIVAAESRGFYGRSRSFAIAVIAAELRDFDGRSRPFVITVVAIEPRDSYGRDLCGQAYSRSYADTRVLSPNALLYV